MTFYTPLERLAKSAKDNGFQNVSADAETVLRLCEIARAAEWEPIATAPAGGGDLFLWWKGRGAGRGRWQCDESGEGWILDGDRVIPAAKYQGDCTHWKPLPVPPAALRAALGTQPVKETQ